MSAETTIKLSNDAIIKNNLKILQAELICHNCHVRVPIKLFGYNSSIDYTDYFCEGGCGRYYCDSCHGTNGVLCSEYAHCSACQSQNHSACKGCAKMVCHQYRGLPIMYSRVDICVVCNQLTLDFSSGLQICEKHQSIIYDFFETLGICSNCFIDGYKYDSQIGKVVKK